MTRLGKAVRRWTIRRTPDPAAQWMQKTPMTHVAHVNGTVLRLVRREQTWYLYASTDQGVTAKTVRCDPNLTLAKRQAEQLGRNPWLLTWPGQP